MKNGSKMFFEICSFVFVFALFCAGGLYCVFNDKVMIGNSVLLRMAGPMQMASAADDRKTPEPEPTQAPPQNTPKPQKTPEPDPIPKMGDKAAAVLPLMIIGAVLSALAIYLLMKRGRQNEAANSQEDTGSARKGG